jgi:hypothetical protein
MSINKTRMKRIGMILLFVGFIILIFLYATHNPFVICLSKDMDKYSFNELKKGDTVRVLNSFDFTKGGFKAILVIKERYDLSAYIPKGKILITHDINVLEQMQKKWIFIYTETDLATVENEFILYQNNEIVFKSGIVLDENIQGLQNSKLGWIISINDLSVYCGKFKRVYLPLIFL